MHKISKKLDNIQYIAVILIFTLIIGLILAFTIENPRYDLVLNNWQLLLEAYFLTILISVIALIGALVFGFILFMMLRSKFTILRAIARVFSEIIMGTPLLVMLFLVAYPLGIALGTRDMIFLGTLALILYNGPYVANAYETTASVVTNEQYIVMDLYQFKWWQKYLYVIFPQMVKPFIPSLVNNLSSVIKGSALLNVLAIAEITYIVTSIAAKNFAFIEGYYIMWILYLTITIPLSLLANYVGKKVSK